MTRKRDAAITANEVPAKVRLGPPILLQSVQLPASSRQPPSSRGHALGSLRRVAIPCGLRSGSPLPRLHPTETGAHWFDSTSRHIHQNRGVRMRAGQAPNSGVSLAAVSVSPVSGMTKLGKISCEIGHSLCCHFCSDINTEFSCSSSWWFSSRSSPIAAPTTNSPDSHQMFGAVLRVNKRRDVYQHSCSDCRGSRVEYEAATQIFDLGHCIGWPSQHWLFRSLTVIAVFEASTLP